MQTLGRDLSFCVQAVRPFAKKIYGKAAMDMPQAQLYEHFLMRVRANMHIVLAFSPIGDAFRDRLRKFPSLINCCAIGEEDHIPHTRIAAERSESCRYYS